MKRVFRFWKIVILDALGVMFMLAALATGWLPGPGGIPLFLIGLGLLALNHEWAERYIDLLKEYADKLGDLVFIKDRRVQIGYDLLAPLLMMTGLAVLLATGRAAWQISLGIFLFFLGLTVLLGNRGRWSRIKAGFKRR